MPILPFPPYHIPHTTTPPAPYLYPTLPYPWFQREKKIELTACLAEGSTLVPHTGQLKVLIHKHNNNNNNKSVHWTLNGLQS